MTLGIAIIVMTLLLVFHVQTIEIAGNKYVSSSEIAESIQSDKNTKNSLYLIGKKLAGKMQFPKAVESAKISLKAPWAVKVTVKEKKMVGYTTTDEEYVFFDEEGMVLHKSDMRMKGVPHIEGVPTEGAGLYEELPAEKRLFKNIKEAMQAFKANKLKPKRIVSTGAELTVYFGKVCVELGSGDMELKITQIPPILEELDGKSGTLNLRYYNETSEIISFKEGKLPEQDTE